MTESSERGNTSRLQEWFGRVRYKPGTDFKAGFTEGYPYVRITLQVPNVDEPGTIKDIAQTFFIEDTWYAYRDEARLQIVFGFIRELELLSMQQWFRFDGNDVFLKPTIALDR